MAGDVATDSCSSVKDSLIYGNKKWEIKNVLTPNYSKYVIAYYVIMLS